MFAVPGWSVSADALKTQIESKAPKVANDFKPAEAAGTDKKSRNGKRSHGSKRGVEVTKENLGDLWREHIEKKSVHHGHRKLEENASQRNQKKRKREEGSVLEESMEINGAAFEGFSETDGTQAINEEEGRANEKKRKKENQKEEKLKSKAAVPAHGHALNTVTAPNPVEGLPKLEDGKAKYEQRKYKAAKKREQKAVIQANGTLPPSCPESTVITSRPAPPTFRKPTQASEPLKPPKTEKATLPAKTIQLEMDTEAANPPVLGKARTPFDPISTATNLTPLQQRMAAKLTSARFRHLNQTLYISPSNEAMRLFTESPQAYTSYHAGFRAQVESWPQNPVESFVQDVKARGKVLVPSQKKMWREQKKGKKSVGPAVDVLTVNADTAGKLDPLPRTKGTCAIADLGCGDAHLAASLDPLRNSLNLKLLSFDLAKGDTPNAHLITVADISHLSSIGVKNGSVDIAICCLSLMGTNWVEVVDECARITKGGGEVWVAEIKSRFGRPEQPKRKGDDIAKKKKGKKSKGDNEDEEDSVALEEIEDAEPSDDSTDVSAFVEVFRKRGLMINGEPDTTNKMFVRMRFVKALRLENEKGGVAKFGDGFRGKQQRLKFVEDKGREVDESKVLKPCVYKTR